MNCIARSLSVNRSSGASVSVVAGEQNWLANRVPNGALIVCRQSPAQPGWDIAENHHVSRFRFVREIRHEGPHCQALQPPKTKDLTPAAKPFARGSLGLPRRDLRLR